MDKNKDTEKIKKTKEKVKMEADKEPSKATDNKSKKRVAKPKLIKVKKNKVKKEKGSKKSLSLKNLFRKKKSSKMDKPPKLTKRDLKKQEKQKIKENNKKNKANSENTKRRRRVTKKALGACCATCGVFAAVALVFMLCGALKPNAGLAMRIDDYKLTEDELTDYICSSTYYASYKKSASGWSSFLSSYGMTPSAFRQSVINSKYKEEELIRRACQDKGIEVSEEEVNSHVDSFRKKFNSETSYKEALDKMGFTPEKYKSYMKDTILKEKLSNKECPTNNPSDSDVVTYLSSAKSTLSGAKKSSSILIKDKTKAQEIADKIKKGEITFEDAVAKFSEDEATKATGGDMGWDKVSSHVSGYDSALNSLSKGETSSAPANCGDGYRIIKCTDVWTAGDKVENLNGVPTEIVEYCRTKKKENTQQSSLSTWLDNYAKEKGITIEIYPMPESVPYNVDTQALVSSTGSTAGTSGTTTTN